MPRIFGAGDLLEQRSSGLKKPAQVDKYFGYVLKRMIDRIADGKKIKGEHAG